MKPYPRLARRIVRRTALVTATAALGVLTLLAGCGGGGGAAVQALPQSVSFDATPSLALDGTATVSASASSGLVVRYSSVTPTVCSVNGQSGLVTALRPGTCTIAVDQAGNEAYAPAAQARLNLPVIYTPNQTIQFATAPALTLGGVATVSATATSGLAVSYSSDSPAVCSVNSSTGVVSSLAVGTCTILADQAGDSTYLPAPQASQNLAVVAPSGVTVPGAPSGVSATSGVTLAEAVVSASSVDGGGSVITSFTAVSSPSGYTATSASLPVRVNCTGSCAGETFTLSATNGVGVGSASAAGHIIDHYDVLEVFREPDTAPNDSIFVGSLDYDFSTGTVANLQGRLSESMTGGATAYPNDTMTWLNLTHQLASWHDAALGGTFAATFKNASTNTFWTGDGGDGWSAQAGVDAGGIYFGFPSAGSNPGNAYALIFVPDNPAAALTQSQIDKLAYADCAPGGMMGSACMTGTSVAGYGSVGTMSGVPVSLTLTRRP
ncbi:hypothetical protein [Aquabacterium sp.]|uniref:hypothetical protein n=1 Tax=Aquabacterium sp. TaxID=1872578 RepID=UPI0035AF8D7C